MKRPRATKIPSNKPNRTTKFMLFQRKTNKIIWHSYRALWLVEPNEHTIRLRIHTFICTYTPSIPSYSTTHHPFLSCFPFSTTIIALLCYAHSYTRTPMKHRIVAIPSNSHTRTIHIQFTQMCAKALFAGGWTCSASNAVISRGMFPSCIHHSIWYQICNCANETTMVGWSFCCWWCLLPSPVDCTCFCTVWRDVQHPKI